MIPCWDKLEGFRLTKSGNLINLKRRRYFYIKECSLCGEEFISSKPEATFCSNKCSSSGENNGMYGKGYLISKERHPLWGKHLSKETRKKMSEAQRGEKNHGFGKRLSEEHKKKIGRHMSEERKKKISLALTGKLVGIKNPFYGRHHSEETKKKIRQNHLGKQTGELNPNWRDGASHKEYCPIFYSEEFRDIIRYRDNSICLTPGCNSATPSKSIHIHHIDYDKKNCDLRNLICVCKSCNSKANFNREWYKELYTRILKIRYGYKYETTKL